MNSFEELGFQETTSFILKSSYKKYFKKTITRKIYLINPVPLDTIYGLLFNVLYNYYHRLLVLVRYQHVYVHKYNMICSTISYITSILLKESFIQGCKNNYNSRNGNLDLAQMTGKGTNYTFVLKIILTTNHALYIRKMNVTYLYLLNRNGIITATGSHGSTLLWMPWRVDALLCKSRPETGK